MPNLREKLRALAETEKNATAGPWNPNWGSILADGISTQVCQVPEGEDFSSEKWNNDRHLIADSRTLLKAFLASWFAQHEALEGVINDVAECESNTNVDAGDQGSCGKCYNCKALLAARKALNLATTPHP